MTAPIPRTPPEIARAISDISGRHGELHAAAAAGTLADAASLDELCLLETELRIFERMCSRHGPMVLMASGLRWGDELRHPAEPSRRALVRLKDEVEMDGETMTIAAATTRLKPTSDKGLAIADWHRGTLRLGDAFGLEHPPRPKAQEPAAVQPSLF